MYNWQEADLFDWLKEYVYFDLVKAKNQMSRWDCYSPKFKHRIELKCRRKHYDSLLIEKSKYDAMIFESGKHLDIPMYINSTPEGIYSFDLLDIEPEWIFKTLRATTHFGNNKSIEKKVAFLDLDTGIKLEL
jgi:hypothetical protein